MARITLIRQEIECFNWYGIDLDGSIGFFANGACRLPDSVAESEEDLRMIVDFFKARKKPISNDAIAFINPNIPTHIVPKRDYGEFIESCTRFSMTGIYYFECDTRIEFPGRYCQITAPSVCLTLDDLPDKITTCLSRYVIPVRFSESTIIEGSLFEGTDPHRDLRG